MPNDVLDASSQTTPSPFDAEFPQQNAVPTLPTTNAIPNEDAPADVREAFARMFKEETGVSPQEFKEVIEMASPQIEEAKAAKQFVQSHPNYHPHPRNEQAITEFLRESGLPMTSENLETAFNTLDAAGVLVSKTVQQSRVQRVNPATQRSTVQRVQQPTPKAAVSEEDIRNLPMEAARQKLLEAMHSQRKPAQRQPQSRFEPVDDFFDEQTLAAHSSPIDAA